MTAERSTYTNEDGSEETVALSRGPLTPHGHAVLRIDYSDGETLDCYVNTGWLRDRLDDLGEPRRIAPPAAITDEMVERARNAPSFDGRLSPTPRLVREMLTAALTEPPARPDGAEQFDAIVDSAIRGHSDITDPAVVRAISNALAEEMNR